MFQEIKDEKKLVELNEELKNNIDLDNINISFSDFDIIGTTEIFYSQTSKYNICYRHLRKEVDILDIDAIQEFCKEKSLALKNIIFNINIQLIDGEEKQSSLKLIELIDYTSDSEMAV